MKKLQNVIIVLTLVLITSCGGGAGKFEGKWKYINENGEGNGKVMVIEKKEDKYALYDQSRPDDSKFFNYDKENDRLTLEEYGQFIDITYDEKEKHMVIAPRGGAGMGMSKLEFEKIN